MRILPEDRITPKQARVLAAVLAGVGLVVSVSIITTPKRSAAAAPTPTPRKMGALESWRAMEAEKAVAPTPKPAHLPAPKPPKAAAPKPLPEMSFRVTHRDPGIFTDTVVIEVTNNTGRDVKDITFEKIDIAPSGTVLGSREFTVYEVFPPGVRTTTAEEPSMERPQTARTETRISGWKPYFGGAPN